ncbi:MAG: hypothetical protein V4629_12410 [Pseudomonadota bacterium]
MLPVSNQNLVTSARFQVGHKTKKCLALGALTLLGGATIRTFNPRAPIASVNPRAARQLSIKNDLCITAQHSGKVFTLTLPEEEKVDISVAVISDCAFEAGSNYKKAAWDIIDNAMTQLNVNGIITNQENRSYVTPCRPSGLGAIKSYEILHKSSWPVSRVGVKGEGLTSEIYSTLKERIDGNSSLHEAARKCRIQTTNIVAITGGTVVGAAISLGLLIRFRHDARVR